MTKESEEAWAGGMPPSRPMGMMDQLEKIKRKVASRPQGTDFDFRHHHGQVETREESRCLTAVSRTKMALYETDAFHVGEPFLSLRLGTVALDRGMLLDELDREWSGRRHERERLVDYALFFFRVKLQDSPATNEDIACAGRETRLMRSLMHNDLLYRLEDMPKDML